MPIGATIGTAVIGAGASIYSGSKAASAQKKAAQTASDTSLQVSRENNALAREFYGKNEGHLLPTISSGQRAGGALMEMLLGPAPTSSGSGSSGGSGSTGSSGGAGSTNPSAGPGTSTGTLPQGQAPASGYTGGGSLISGIVSAAQSAGADRAQKLYDSDGLPPLPAGADPNSPAVRAYYMGGEPMMLRSGGPGSALNGGPAPTGALAPYASATSANGPTYGSTATGPAAGGGAAADGTTSALSAWDQFRNSTNYQFRLDQGLNAVGTKFAAAGAFESGAEKKAILEYAQNFAANELAAYMDRLYQQQALGVNAASALAGVGTNMVNQVSANNRYAGDAAANAALMSGQATANQWGTVGSAIGSAAGTIGGAMSSSYNQPAFGSPVVAAGDGMDGGWFYPGMG